MMSLDYSKLGIPFLGGSLVVVGLFCLVVSLVDLFTQTDSQAVGTVIQLEAGSEGGVTGSVIEFADSDRRNYTFSSEHRPSRVGDTVDVQFAARDPEGTARTSADRRSSGMVLGCALVLIPAGGAVLYYTERHRRQSRDGPPLVRYTHGPPPSA